MKKEEITTTEKSDEVYGQFKLTWITRGCYQLANGASPQSLLHL